MSQDNATTSRLRAIADRMEHMLGTSSPAALSRDPSAGSQLKRIETAVDDLAAELSSILDTIASIEAALPGYVPTGDPQTVSFVVEDPANTKTHTERGTKSFGAWLNTSGKTFTLSRVVGISDVDNYQFVLFKSASETDLSTTNDVQLVAVDCSDNGTQVYSSDVSAFDVSTVEDGKWIIWEHSSGSALSLTVVIEGTFA